MWVVFLTSRGIDFSQVGFLDGAFSLALIAFEVPTGYIGDRIGRRNSILVGIVVSAVASIGFAFSHSFPLFVTVYVGLAVAQTFRSGTDTAWLYDALGERLTEERFTHVKGRANALGYVMTALAAVVGGYVGNINLAYPWIMEGVAYLIGIPLVLSFPETDITDDEGSRSGCSTHCRRSKNNFRSDRSGRSSSTPASCTVSPARSTSSSSRSVWTSASIRTRSGGCSPDSRSSRRR
uniref:MFS transporter n=1 Tax=Halobacterium sp. (strain GN101) TaxID=88773 RepID=UPI00159EC82F|nr:MFS transporter [Halobacterium sp. GN101]